MTGAFCGFYSHDTSLVCFGWLAVNEDKSCCFEMGNTARMFLCGQKSVTSVATCALHTAAFIGFALSDVGQIPLSVPLCLPALRCELWRCRGFCSKCVCVCTWILPWAWQGQLPAEAHEDCEAAVTWEPGDILSLFSLWWCWKETAPAHPTHSMILLGSAL